MFKLEEEKKNQPDSTMPSGTASSDGGEKESFLEWTERTKANVPVQRVLSFEDYTAVKNDTQEFNPLVYDNSSARKTSGGYYSFNGPSGEDYDRAVTGTQKYGELYKKSSDVVTAASYKKKEFEDDLEAREKELASLGLRARLDRTGSVAALYNQRVTEYKAAYGDYKNWYDGTYAPIMGDHQLIGQQFDKYGTAYMNYNTEAAKEYDNWKTTVRDEKTVEAELATARERAENLRKEKAEYDEDKRLSDTGYNSWASWENSEDPVLRARYAEYKANREKLFADADAKDKEYADAQEEVKLLEEELGYSRGFKYEAYKNAADFEEKSKYDPQYLIDETYSKINLKYDDAHPYYGDEAHENRHANKEYSQITPEEQAIYNYLYATNKAEADKYYEYLHPQLTARQREAETKAVLNWTDESDFNKVLANVGTIVLSPLKAVSYLGQAADLINTGKIDQNAEYNKFSYLNNAVRENTKKNWGEVGTFAYQTGMSMLDFLWNAFLTGGLSGAGGKAAENLSLLIMGAGAAADTVIEQKDRGMDDARAFTLGTVAGIAEVVTEKVSLEAILSPDLTKGKLRFIVKNALAEGSEEVGSDLINYFADDLYDLISGQENSKWKEMIRKYKEQDPTCSDAKAFGLAIGERAKEVGLDFAGGLLSGGVLAGVRAGAYTYQTSDFSKNRATGKALSGMELGTEDYQAIINEGLAAPEGSEARKAAEQMQVKLDAGKKVSNTEYGKLLRLNEAQIADETIGEGAGIIHQALEQVDEDGKPSYEGAKAILNNEAALRILSENTDLNLTKPMSVNDRIEAVRDAVAKYDEMAVRAKAEERAAGTKQSTETAETATSDTPSTGSAALDSVLRAISDRGTVTNKQAMAIMADRTMLDALSEITGIDLSYTGQQASPVTANAQITAVKNAAMQAAESFTSTGSEGVDTLLTTVEEGRTAAEERAQNVTELLGIAPAQNEQITAQNEQISTVEGIEARQQELITEAAELRDAGAITPETIARLQEINREYQALEQDKRTLKAAEPFREIVDKGGNRNEQAQNQNESERAGVEQTEGDLSLSDEYAGRRAAQRKRIEAPGVSQEVRLKGRTAEQRQAAVTRRDAAAAQPYVSPGTLGIENGSDVQSMRLLPHADWDAEVTAAEEHAASHGVKNFVPFIGEMYITDGKGNSAAADAYIDFSTGTLYVRADTLSTSVSENTEHEINHWLSNQNEWLVDDFMAAVKKNKEAAWRPVYETYKRRYSAIADFDAMSEKEAERYVFEEILGDAKARIDRFGVRASAFNAAAEAAYAGEVTGSEAREGVNAMTDETAAATERTNGPGKLVESSEELKQSGRSAISNEEYWETNELNEERDAIRQEIREKESEEYNTKLLREGGVDAVTKNAADIRKLEKKLAEAYGDKERKIRTETKVKPTISKAELRQSLMRTFSTPEGMRQEIGNYIDSFADKIVRNGALTEADRTALFDRLYESGAMRVKADEFYSDMAKDLRQLRIYVNEQTRGDFGDDWNDIRKRAFAAGIYLTSSIKDRGADSIWREFSEYMPGQFDPDEIDMRTMIETIVGFAEEGKDQRMSLAEYTDMLVNEQHIPEAEIFREFENQLDYNLKAFAEKAGLEIKLKSTTGAESLKRMREDYRQKVNDLKQESAEKVKNVQNDLRQKYSDREEKRRLEARLRDEQRRERQALREMQERTLKQLQWIKRNQNKMSAEQKAAAADILADFDLYAIGQANEMNWSKKHGATWKDLKQMYLDAKADPNFMPSEELERIVHRLDDAKIGDLDIDALTDLYKAAIGFRQEYYSRKNMLGTTEHELIQQVYEESTAELKAASKNRKAGNSGLAEKFFSEWQLTPMNRLERMAGWNPDSTWYKSMARQLEEGEREMRRFEARSKAYLAEFNETHQEWLAKADGQGKEAIWYELEVPELLEYGKGDKPIFGKTVKVSMTPLQKVHMYLESKNFDNLRHMEGGRTFANKELYAKGERAEAFNQGTTVRLAPETVKKIVSNLTAEEQELANLLESYYNTFARDAINEKSNILYGYDKAMNKNYAPIFTNKNYVHSEAGKFDLTAEGVGNLKERNGFSGNPSLNISAIEAFDKSVEKTKKFVGLAIPVRNWNSLLNWRNGQDTMRQNITNSWGGDSVKWIDDLLVELQNGREIKHEAIDAAVNKVLSKYISGVFGLNPSIVLKQFASFPLAATYLGWNNMQDVFRKVDDSIVNTYTSELAYRLLGYSSPETAQLVENPTKLQQKGILNFALGGGAITWMDGATVRTLWNWSENKVNRENALRPENERLNKGTEEQIKKGDSEYYKEVARVFEEAVSRTQPMYDVMHRSEAMRGGGAIQRAFTLFKTVPQQEYNMLVQSIGEARYYKSIGADASVIRAAKAKTGRAVLGIVTGNLMIGVITFLNALWKSGAKRYKDKDGELTVESVLGQFLKQFGADTLGVSIFGDTAADILGNFFCGDKLYDIETPGMGQINDIIEELSKVGAGLKTFIGESINIISNGGDWGQYASENSDKLLSAVDKAARILGTYIAGLPTDNIKGYLLGTLRLASPKIATAYEDLLDHADKSGLKGLEGEALRTRTGHVLQDRVGGVSEETIEAVASLYESGHKAAVPPDIAESYTVDSEKRELNAFQQQVYKNTWKSIVQESIDNLVKLDAFQDADEDAREKMFQALYDYAAEKAKEAVFSDYESDETKKPEHVIAEGGSEEDWAAFKGQTAGLEHAKDKYAVLIDSEYDDNVKLALAGTVMGIELETEKGNPSSYAKLREIVGLGLETGDALKLKRDGIDLDTYLKYATSGTDPYDAFRIVYDLKKLEPLEGAKTVKTYQKWRVALNNTSGYTAQLKAIEAATPSTEAKHITKMKVAHDYGMDLDVYVTLKEWLPEYDENGNGNYSGAEVQAAIDGISGGALIPSGNGYAPGLKLSNKQKAALWQLFTGNKSAKNNPYDIQTGHDIIEAMSDDE